jgi:zeaxanthin glucosyltransferase
VQEIGADAIVSDQMEAAGGLVADYLRLPFASVATALPINREEMVPPPYVSWSYDPSERGRKRNRGGYRVSDWLMRPVGDVIERHSRAFGLGPRRTAEQCLSPFAQLAQCTKGLDFPRQELPENFHYLGPFRDGGTSALELPSDDGRPFAFCSFGTLQGGRVRLFRNVAEACAKLGLRLVIAHGGRLDPRAAAKLPGDPFVTDYVPHPAVLRRAAIAITHAGFNTVLDALAHAVPMVAIPLAFEQPATAARLVCAGAGRAVRPIQASSARLQREIVEVLNNPTYRERASSLRSELHASGGVRRAADILEAMLA